MERKKIFRSVWFWVGLVVVLAVVFSSFIRGNGGFKQVPTSVALAQFDDNNVSSVTINDKEQTLDIDVKQPVEGSNKITTSYPIGASDDVYLLISGRNATGNGGTDGNGVKFDTNVTQDSVWGSLLISFLPFVILLVLLFWLFNS